MRHATIAKVFVPLALLLSVESAAAQNPLSDWVRKNKRDYKVRTSPNSFHLLGYVYINSKLTPPPAARGSDCLSDALQRKIADKDSDVVASAEDKVFNSQVKSSDIDAFLTITGKNLKAIDKADLTASLKRHRVTNIQLETGHVTEYILTSRDLEGMTPECNKRLKRDGNMVAVAQALGIDGARYSLRDEKGNEVAVDAELGSQLAKFGLGSSGTTMQTAVYDKPIFFGFVPAKYCSKKHDYRQKCGLF